MENLNGKILVVMTEEGKVFTIDGFPSSEKSAHKEAKEFINQLCRNANAYFVEALADVLNKHLNQRGF